MKKEKKISNSVPIPKKLVSSRVTMKSDDKIEIDFEGLDTTERLNIIKNLYKVWKKEQVKAAVKEQEREKSLHPDCNIRKTYRLKLEVAENFAKKVISDNEEIGICVTILLETCIEDTYRNNVIPSMAVNKKDTVYKNKSYRVKNATAEQFDVLCEKYDLKAGLVQQKLMEEYLLKGEH